MSIKFILLKKNGKRMEMFPTLFRRNGQHMNMCPIYFAIMDSTRKSTLNPQSLRSSMYGLYTKFVQVLIKS